MRRAADDIVGGDVRAFVRPRCHGRLGTAPKDLKGFSMFRTLRLCATLAVVTAGLTSNVLAENRFYFDDVEVDVGSSGVELIVRADSDIPFFGFSFGVTYDEQVLVVQSVTWEGALTDEPSYYKGIIDNDTGRMAFGCVFDYGPEYDSTIPAGEGHAISTVVVDILAQSNTTTELTFATVPFNPERPVTNVMTNGGGLSEFPTLVNGTVTISIPAPEITAVQGGSGFAGDMFVVVGNNFDQGGLEVTVCDAPAAVELNEDGSLTVTAPDCASAPGAVDVVVCTDGGCDTETDGFTYLAPEEPEITAIDPAAGPAGAVISISGNNLGGAGRQVRICEQDVESELADGVVTATVPDCGEAGVVEVELCTEDGCDTEAFTFEVPEAIFIRGDSNGAAGVDVSDAIYSLNRLFGDGPPPECLDAADANDDGGFDVSDPIYALNFLFGDGPDIPAPYPDPGVDPTPDDFPDC